MKSLNDAFDKNIKKLLREVYSMYPPLKVVSAKIKPIRT
jgi:hypothetical protein